MTNMDDCIRAVPAAVAAYRCRKQGIKNFDKLALVVRLLDDEDVIVSRTHICGLCNTSYTYVHGTDYMMLEAACTALFAWYVANCQLHSCGRSSARNDRRPRAGPCHGSE